MRIAVLGAGAVGGTLAALLAHHGHQVEVTARGEQLTALRMQGLRLEGGWGTFAVRVEAGAALTRRPELVLLTTKAQDAAGALHAEAELIEGVPLVVVQNGLGGLRVAHEVLPGSPLAARLVGGASGAAWAGAPVIFGTHSWRNHAMVIGSPASRRCAAGTICSPISMPSSPTSAIAGGAGERTCNNA